jgi:hypothetical protein
MKVFIIIEHFPAGGGHKVTVVRADEREEALTLYREHNHRSVLRVDVEEITERVTEVFRYDNPGYEG